MIWLDSTIWSCFWICIANDLELEWNCAGFGRWVFDLVREPAAGVEDDRTGEHWVRPGCCRCFRCSERRGCRCRRRRLVGQVSECQDWSGVLNALPPLGSEDIIFRRVIVLVTGRITYFFWLFCMDLERPGWERYMRYIPILWGFPHEYFRVVLCL